MLVVCTVVLFSNDRPVLYMSTRFAGGSCPAVPSAALVCAQCPAVACVLVVCGGLWRCAVLVALSLATGNSPRIDFKPPRRRLLSLGYTRVAQCMKNALKSLILECEHLLTNRAQKNTSFLGWCTFGLSLCLWHVIDQHPELIWQHNADLPPAL